MFGLLNTRFPVIEAVNASRSITPDDFGKVLYAKGGITLTLASSVIYPAGFLVTVVKQDGVAVTITRTGGVFFFNDGTVSGASVNLTGAKGVSLDLACLDGTDFLALKSPSASTPPTSGIARIDDNQAVDAGFTALNLTETTDSGGFFEPTTPTLVTVSEDGVYAFNYGLRTGVSAPSDVIEMLVLKNGATGIHKLVGLVLDMSGGNLCGSFLANLAAGDTVTFKGFSSSAGAMTTDQGFASYVGVSGPF